MCKFLLNLLSYMEDFEIKINILRIQFLSNILYIIILNARYEIKGGNRRWCDRLCDRQTMRKSSGMSEQSVSVTMDHIWSDALCIFYNSSLFFSRTLDTCALFGK